MRPLYCADCGRERKDKGLGLFREILSGSYTRPCECGSYWVTLVRPSVKQTLNLIEK